uniref:hypothetical protein n=1 Tax=Xanthomonas cucurbitae TaxID=56453 RepID=UPI003EBD4F26
MPKRHTDRLSVGAHQGATGFIDNASSRPGALLRVADTAGATGLRHGVDDGCAMVMTYHSRLTGG